MSKNNSVKDLSELVKAILREESTEKLQKEYYLIIKRIVLKVVRRKFQYADHKELEEITNEVTQNFFLWIVKEDKKKGFSRRKHRLTAGYLLKKINALVLDFLKKEITKNKYVSLTLDKIVSSKEREEKTTFGELLPSEDNLLKIVDLKALAISILNLIEEKLKDEQIKTLCHLIFREKYSRDCYAEDISSAAKYKRIERLKKTLREILKENPLTEEEWKVFVNLMEDYCQNRFGKCV